MLQGDALDSLVKSFGLAAVGLSALGLVLKYRPWERRHHPHMEVENGTSGSKPVSFWRNEFRCVVKECLEEYDRGRMDRIREIVREEITKGLQ